MSFDRSKVCIAFALYCHGLSGVRFNPNSLLPLQIKPVPIQKTIVLLNNFVANTTNFFNAFSETVEKKISSVSNKITELETLLAVLEAKLNSVPDLDSFTSDQLPVHTAEPTAPVPVHTNDVTHSEVVAVTEEVVVGSDPSKVPVCEHPDYVPFFRLLKVGVPPFVVQAKVTAAGLDGSMIDTPDRMISL